MQPNTFLFVRRSYQHTSPPHLIELQQPPPPPYHHHQLMRQSTIVSLVLFLEDIQSHFFRICIPNVGLKLHNPTPFFSFNPPLSHITSYHHFSRFIYHPPSTGVAYVILPIPPIHSTVYIGRDLPHPPIPNLDSVMFIINCIPPYPYL